MFIQKFLLLVLSAISTITTQNNTYSLNLSHVVSKNNETSFLSETTTADPQINITTNTYEKIQFKITNYILVANETKIYLYKAKNNQLLAIFLVQNTEDKTYEYQYNETEQLEKMRLEFRLDNNEILKTATKPAKPVEYDNPQLTIKENLYNKFTFTIDNYTTIEIPCNLSLVFVGNEQYNETITINEQKDLYTYNYHEELQYKEITIQINFNDAKIEQFDKPTRPTNETPILTLRTNTYDGFAYTIDNYAYTEKPINLSIFFDNTQHDTISINQEEDIYTYSYPEDIYEQATQITIKYNNATILNFTKKAKSTTKLQEPIIEWIDNDIYSRTLMYTVENNNSIQVDYVYLLANGTYTTKTINAKKVENISINYQNTQENITYGGKFTTSDTNYKESDTIEYTTSIVGYDIEYKRNNNDNVSFYVNVLQPITEWTITANNQTYDLEESLTSFNIEGAATEFVLKYKNEVKETYKINLYEEKAGDYVDIPSLILTIITLPFSFISQAFNITLFKGTPYAINVSTMLLTIVGGAILIWLIVKIIKIIKP